jgi:hypothetical protein
VVPFWRNASGTGDAHAIFVRRAVHRMPEHVEFAVLHTYRWRVRNDALA